MGVSWTRCKMPRKSPEPGMAETNECRQMNTPANQGEKCLRRKRAEREATPQAGGRMTVGSPPNSGHRLSRHPILNTTGNNGACGQPRLRGLRSWCRQAEHRHRVNRSSTAASCPLERDVCSACLEKKPRHTGQSRLSAAPQRTARLQPARGPSGQTCVWFANPKTPESTSSHAFPAQAPLLL